MADEVTIQSETKRLDRLSNDLAEAQDELDRYIATMEKRQKEAAIGELLELAETVKLAQKVVAKCQSDVNATKATVERLQWEAKAKPLMDARDALKRSVLDAYGKVAATFKQFGVERTKLEIDGTGDTPIATLNISGGALPKPSVTERGYRGGGRRSKPLTVDGTEYPSASAAMRAFYPDSGPLSRLSIISRLANTGHTVS